MRICAIQAVGGFNGALIAGEEPELCSRLRKAGWRIIRLDAEMTLHDADMLRFRQWWRRTKRAGWAFINGAVMEARSRGYRWVREAVRPWLWCLAVPAGCAALSLLGGLWGLMLLLVYPLIAARATRSAVRRGSGIRTALAFGVLSVIGKIAELQGQLTWLQGQLRHQPLDLIEYKNLG